MARQRDDDVQAGAGLFRGQVADFDDAVARKGLAGQSRQQHFHRIIEITLKKQRLLAGAAPAGGGEHLFRRLDQQQLRREGSHASRMVAQKNGLNEPFCLVATRRIDIDLHGADRASDGTRGSGVQQKIGGKWHVCSIGVIDGAQYRDLALSGS